MSKNTKGIIVQNDLSVFIAEQFRSRRVIKETIIPDDVVLTYEQWVDGLSHEEQLLAERTYVRPNQVYTATDASGAPYTATIVGFTAITVAMEITYSDGAVLTNRRSLSLLANAVTKGNYTPVLPEV